MSTSANVDRACLTADDLVPDEPLSGTGKRPIPDSDDLLHHRVIAKKVAELATSANGRVNIALFGPWGAGKSSFNGLLREELARVAPKARHVTFDAWKNAGEGFRTNFLSELARQIPNADQGVSDQLFQARTRVTLPLDGVLGRKHGRTTKVSLVVLFLLALFLLIPLLWTFLGSLASPSDNFVQQWWKNITGWAGVAAGSTLVLVVATGLLELSKVTVSRSTPSYIAQFSKLFNRLLKAGKSDRYVVFVDELDRCGEDDVMATLEGLRTFLGHDRCVFVVAFDRDAIATTIAKHMRHSVPSQSAAPYYRTSGEYLDKIFQFQLALPPQMANTFRRFALSLVSERGGVWAQLRAHGEGLLERVVTVLSPMHLASPRRTKVLLNDFAINARIYESLGFEWLNRAEEIAVLTVIQTEFPNLMADIEHAPSLMRFLYRDETPKRLEINTLLSRYRSQRSAEPGQNEADTDGMAEVQLDSIAAKADTAAIAEGLQENLARYLRRLREMDVPEPGADLIMMHSDGNLLHFEDPGVYQEVLLAADMPRRDVVEALSTASASDRVLAIEHVLEQAEGESSDIALNLRVIAGEVAAGLPELTVRLSNNMRSIIAAGLYRHTRDSLDGYTRAASVIFTENALMNLLDAAEQQSVDVLGTVADRLAEELRPADWKVASSALLPRVLPVARELPDATARILARIGQDGSTALEREQVKALAKSLSVSKPEDVEPSANTAAARQEAEEQNQQAQERFEEDRATAHAAANALLAAWQQLPAAGRMRGSLLEVLRTATDGSTWYLERHDELVAAENASGEEVVANSHLLTAITEQPRRIVRWVKMLSDDTAVEGDEKARALDAVVVRATTATPITARENYAEAALHIASLPSSTPLSAVELLSTIVDDIAVDWEDYADNRFEYQSTLLHAVDLLKDDKAPSTTPRTQLVLGAVTAAQEEEVSVEQITRYVTKLPAAEAAAVATTLSDAHLWEDDHPEYSMSVLLAAQEAAFSGGERIEPLPAAAIAQLTDADVRAPLAEAWLATAPPVADVRALLGKVAFPTSVWSKYGERAAEEDRAEAWDALVRQGAPALALRLLSRSGQPSRIYATAATDVRDAATKQAREAAVARFLALPKTTEAAALAQGLVKAMASAGKVTELPLGLQLMKAYHSQWSKATVNALRPHLRGWLDAGESYLSHRDREWLIRSGYVIRKSGFWERRLGGKN
jgi:hypothetical protein